MSRYTTIGGERWVHYTTLDGLPSDPIQCLATDDGGKVWVGTPCDGIAVAQSPYNTWKRTTGPDKLSRAASGSGLPTNQINSMLIGRDSTIWVATTAGLAYSKNNGKSFNYIRGADWTDKAKGLYQPI